MSIDEHFPRFCLGLYIQVPLALKRTLHLNKDLKARISTVQVIEITHIRREGKKVADWLASRVTIGDFILTREQPVDFELQTLLRADAHGVL